MSKEVKSCTKVNFWVKLLLSQKHAFPVAQQFVPEAAKVAAQVCAPRTVLLDVLFHVGTLVRVTAPAGAQMYAPTCVEEAAK